MTLLNTESFSFDTNREILIKFEQNYLNEYCFVHCSY